MKKFLESCKFAGDTISTYSNGLDVEVEVNDKHFGVYLSAGAGISAAQKYITRTLEDGKRK